MTINNKSERNYRGKYLGWPVTSYGADKKNRYPVYSDNSVLWPTKKKYTNQSAIKCEWRDKPIYEQESKPKKTESPKNLMSINDQN